MWAKLSETKEGDTLIADGEFECVAAGPHIVKADSVGALYIECHEGVHHLCGQVDDGDNMIGLTRPQ